MYYRLFHGKTQLALESGGGSRSRRRRLSRGGVLKCVVCYTAARVGRIAG